MNLRALAVLCALGGTAVAQPADPYAGQAAPAYTPPDKALDEQIATSLVSRAQELFEAKEYQDAKQLAVEALVRAPQGATADKAHAIVRAANAALGIREAPPPGPGPDEQVDHTPIQDPTLATKPVPPPPPPSGAPDLGNPRPAAMVHGALAFGTIGAMIGSTFSGSHEAAGAIPVGIVFGAAGAYLTPKLTDKLGWDKAEVRTVGSGTVWGGIAGGLIADIAKTDGTTGRQVLIGGTVGVVVGGGAGLLLAHQKSLTRGDIALVDTLAGVGALGGLTIGMLMQPAQSEAYSLNSVLGIAGGVVIGLVAAPRTNTTEQRMIRVAGVAAAGGALPLIILPFSHGTAGQRTAGGLSTLGMLGGLWLGFHLTRHLDEGMDTLDGRKHLEVDDAPAALIGRHSDGRWALNGIGIQPTSRDLTPNNGATLTLLGATW
ncbi:MAG TPA: hypothetical protein VGM88_27735 [Kofleriaceae bacterium]|jgi:hypothetical protein